MQKGLSVNSLKEYAINKLNVHSIVKELKKLLNFEVDELKINFVSNEYILEVNRNYLNHNYYTDIITFNYSDNKTILDAEIFISIDEAKENAYDYKCTIQQELLRLIIHGILHLLGYDDLTKDEKKIMKKEEDNLVNKLLFLLNRKEILNDC